MANIDPRILMGNNMVPGINQRQVLTSDDVARIKRVEDMQVRTQAASLTCQMLCRRAHNERTFLKWARTIEEYIREGTFNGDPLSSI